jgi:hypothetical protein
VCATHNSVCGHAVAKKACCSTLHCMSAHTAHNATEGCTIRVCILCHTPAHAIHHTAWTCTKQHTSLHVNTCCTQCCLNMLNQGALQHTSLHTLHTLVLGHAQSGCAAAHIIARISTCCTCCTWGCEVVTVSVGQHRQHACLPCL